MPEIPLGLEDSFNRTAEPGLNYYDVLSLERGSENFGPCLSTVLLFLSLMLEIPYCTVAGSLQIASL